MNPSIRPSVHPSIHPFNHLSTPSIQRIVRLFIKTLFYFTLQMCRVSNSVFLIIVSTLLTVIVVKATDCEYGCHGTWNQCFSQCKGYHNCKKCNTEKETCLEGCEVNNKPPALRRAFASRTEDEHPRRPKKLKLRRKLKKLVKGLERQLMLQ